MNIRFIKLSKHAYKRLMERVTWMTRAEAEKFVRKELNKCRRMEILENGVAYIYKGIKYIVRNNIIVTLYLV
ncbi:hypothetical protein [Bacillus taeanensis]|uniref:Uncharacterized protein n=1 Tax=Bacillus taeanensis TaxID=273032 RepID=A0A366Y3Z8_9BACI|nr:hypothetical protein [Bacillus taeanensis]RBW71114.1 hypothetical protein DS031_03725 [Bacillus taeanensis]